VVVAKAAGARVEVVKGEVAWVEGAPAVGWVACVEGVGMPGVKWGVDEAGG
jgi:hypothetical protein